MPELISNTVSVDALATAALYVGLNILILLALGFNTSLKRAATNTIIGDGEDDAMYRAFRAHANASEWVPSFLVGLVLVAIIGAPLIAIHVLGAVFTIARIAHGIGLSTSSKTNPARFIGALATLFCYLILGLGLVVHAGMSLI